VPPLVLSIARLVVVYIPAAIIAARLFGYVGVYVATAVVTVLFGILGRYWNQATIRRLTPADAG
jgi:Na+-driven multidrug efflux pump